MTRGKGQTAQPGRSADKMVIMGGVHLMLTPEKMEKIMSGAETIIELGNARELVLQIEQGSQNRILELTPWFDPSSARVVVQNSVQDDGETGYGFELSDHVEFRLKESEGCSLGFSVTPAQARELGAALTAYAEAWNALKALGKVTPLTRAEIRKAEAVARA